jgi:glycosyltransferase involved in cell wall biosynthesis
VSQPSNKVAVIIPALNEEGSIFTVVNCLPRALVHRIIVVDNGSTDATPDEARRGGAEVVLESRRGYGQACLRGIAELQDEDVVLFIDADGSDDPADIPDVLSPILSGEVDFVVGSRALGRAEPGSMTPPQAFGNWLATRLIWLLWGVRYHDLGPLRAIRRSALTQLQMRDTNYGWTVEMQIRVIECGISFLEVSAAYRKRNHGHSKISGTVKGVVYAGVKILFTIFRFRFLPRRSYAGTS